MHRMAELPALLAFKQWANAELLDVLAAAESHLAPSAMRPMVRTLNHTWVVDRIFTAHLMGMAHGFAATNTDQTPDVAALRGAITDSDRMLVDFARTSPEWRLAEAVSFLFTDGSPGVMTRRQMLQHLVTHGAYHRGQVGQMLKDNGLSPPRELMTRFVAASR